MPNELSERTSGERLGAVDLMRGIAVLGVFVMNIRDFSMPLRSFDDPLFAGGSAAINLPLWAIANVFFQDKMIALLSMLYGAGILLLAEKSRTDGLSPTAVHLKRNVALFLLGMAHAYLLWFGDILNTYALCAFALWPLRKLSAKKLLAIGAAISLLAVILRQWPELYRDGVRPWLIESWHPREKPPMKWDEAYRSNWIDLFRWRAWLNFYWHFDGGLAFNIWRCGGAMLLGMGLLKADVFSASADPTNLRMLQRFGFGFGFPLCLSGVYEALAKHPILGPRFGLASFSKFEPAMTIAASFLIALGYAATIALWHRRPGPSIVRERLTIVGKTALSVYLLQTIVSVTVLDPWGLARWGTWRFAQQIGFVLAVNAVLIVLASFWHRRFGQGPFERLLRSAYRR